MLNILQSVDLSKCSLIDSVSTNSSSLAKSLAKLSSGMKINSAADDPSGYQISERMEGKLVVGETYFINDGTSNTTDAHILHSGIRINSTTDDKPLPLATLEVNTPEFPYSENLENENAIVAVGTDAMFPAFDVEVA